MNTETHMDLWWLSFVHPEKPEGQRFAGACMVHGTDLRSAVTEAHRLGCNPGGEVMGVPSGKVISARVRAKAPGYIGVLLSRDRCEEFDLVMEAVPE